MDNFMDKLAQRFNAQEMIKANSQAEQHEMERLRAQLGAYEDCLQEMRKLNLKNAEAVDQMQKLAAVTMEKISALSITEEGSEDEQKELLQELKTALTELGQKSEASFAQTEEAVHKENVKVYRNVQAVIIDETKNQTTELKEAIGETGKHGKAVTLFAVVILLLSLGNLAVLLLHIFGVI